MERKAYELSKDSPLRAVDPDSLQRTSAGVCTPHSPVAIEPGPQMNPLGGFPMGTGVGGQSGKPGMGRTGGFQEQVHANEVDGAKHQVQQFIGGNEADALSPDQTPRWLQGKTLGPAVPRWEEQPERSTSLNSIAPSPKLVSPTASSY